MRIEQTVDALQGQSSAHQRVATPPSAAPPRRVQAIGQAADGEDRANVAVAPPDDAILLDLSPEGREAARRAALDEMQKQLMRRRDGPGQEAQASAADDRQVEELRRKDRDARAREQALRAAAGNLSAGRSNYTYQVGPDGRLYVVESEVQFDTSEVPGDPEATLRKAEQLQRAALATGDASPEDRAVAAMAAMMAARARQQLTEEKKRGRD
jgi:hypothetical protein